MQSEFEFINVEQFRSFQTRFTLAYYQSVASLFRHVLYLMTSLTTANMVLVGRITHSQATCPGQGIFEVRLDCI